MFNRQNLKTIREDLATALELVEQKHGIKFTVGNIRFSENDFRAKLECVSAANGTNKIDLAREKFERDAPRIGVKSDSFGKTFEIGGTMYMISGVNIRAKKYPIIGTGPRGGQYKFSTDQIGSELTDWS